MHVANNNINNNQPDDGKKLVQLPRKQRRRYEAYCKRLHELVITCMQRQGKDPQNAFQIKRYYRSQWHLEVQKSHRAKDLFHLDYEGFDKYYNRVVDQYEKDKSKEEGDEQ